MYILEISMFLRSILNIIIVISFVIAFIKTIKFVKNYKLLKANNLRLNKFSDILIYFAIAIILYSILKNGILVTNFLI